MSGLPCALAHLNKTNATKFSSGVSCPYRKAHSDEGRLDSVDREMISIDDRDPESAGDVIPESMS